MKFERIFTLFCVCASLGSVYAQENNDTDSIYAEYQLPNSDFEANWTYNEYTSAFGGGVSYSEDTPDYWNSFYRAGGELAEAALKLFSNQVGSVKEVAGYDGTGSAALIFSRKNMMGSISNGNLTTGIINMGDYTASNEKNYNYSDLDNPTGRCEFVGLPDSVSAYFHFQPVADTTGFASMNMILHSRYEYKDPGLIMGTEDSLKYLVASAKALIDKSEGWVRYSAKFNYNGENYKVDEKRYMLVSFSTNEKPGVGSEGDSLSIDNIRMIYNSRLERLQINGADVEGFDKNVYEYEIDDFAPVSDKITAVADGVSATTEVSAEGGTVTVTVKGGDYDVNPGNVHTYSLKFTRSTEADYQLPNFDFEDMWTYNEYQNSEGTVTYSENTPAFWNSFYRADGQFAEMALKLMANQTGSVKQTAGYDGEGSAALIFSRKNFLGTISNGNLTTGIVHMGSYTASDMNNYNYSDIDNPAGRCTFEGLPDSVSVYMKFEPADASMGNASMNIILHSEYEYKDPGLIMGTEDSLKYLVAAARTAVPECREWTRYSVPFEYNGENYAEEGQRYMLVSFSTNEKPGVGSNGDSLSIDNIRMIYNSRLERLQINGADVEGFDKNVYEYEIEGEVPALENVTAVADGIGATVETAAEGDVLTVTVKGNDFDSNPENMHIYTINFTDVTGIHDAVSGNVKAEMSGNVLTVEGADGENVEVYTAQGVKIAEFIADGEAHRVDAAGCGVYIVRIGARVLKVAVR